MTNLLDCVCASSTTVQGVCVPTSPPNRSVFVETLSVYKGSVIVATSQVCWSDIAVASCSDSMGTSANSFTHSLDLGGARVGGVHANMVGTSLGPFFFPPAK